MRVDLIQGGPIGLFTFESYPVLEIRTGSIALGIGRHLTGAFSAGGYPAKHGCILLNSFHWAASETVAE